MALTNVRHGQARALYVDANSEGTFGTANGSYTHCFYHPADWSRLEVGLEKLDNDGYASGNTWDGPSAHLPIARSLQGSATVWASLESMAVFTHKAFGGADSYSGAGPYIHSLTYATTPGFLPGISLEEHSTGATANATTDIQHLGVCVDSFKLSARTTGLATVTAGLIGSGLTAAASTQTDSGLKRPGIDANTELCGPSKFRLSMMPASSVGTTPWDGSHAVHTAAGAFVALETSFVEISSGCQSFDFEVMNGGAVQNLGGTSTTAGNFASQVYTAKREAFLTMTHLFSDETDQLIRLLAASTVAAQGEYAFIIDIAGPTNNYGGYYVIPLAALAENPTVSSGTGPATITTRWKVRKSNTIFLSAYFANTDAFDYD